MRAAASAATWLEAGPRELPGCRNRPGSSEGKHVYFFGGPLLLLCLVFSHFYQYGAEKYPSTVSTLHPKQSPSGRGMGVRINPDKSGGSAAANKDQAVDQ